MQKWVLKRITPGRLTFIREAAGQYRNIFSAANTFFYDTVGSIQTLSATYVFPNAAVLCRISFGDEQ